MSILARIFVGNPKPPVGDVNGLIQYIRKWGPTKFCDERVPAALRALSAFPSHNEALQFLTTWASSGTVCQSATVEAAIEALGHFNNPAATDSLVKIAASTNGCCARQQACDALRRTGARPAIAQLLQIALTYEWPKYIKAALEALRLIGTSESLAAIEEFRRSPSRRVLVQYFETPESHFSSDLGQTPGDDEWRAVLSALGNNIRWAKRDAALTAVRSLLTRPDNTSLLHQVETFLNNDKPEVPYPSIHKLTAYPSELTAVGIQHVIDLGLADVPGRKQAIRELIASSDMTALKNYLGTLENGRTNYKTLCELVGLNSLRSAG